MALLSPRALRLWLGARRAARGAVSISISISPVCVM